MRTRNPLFRTARAAFTLIELLLVLVILGVLAAVVVPKLAGRGEQARQAAARTDITNLEGALDQFETDAGRYPTADEGLQALVNPPSNVKAWNGPYVKAVPNDPWGHAYNYRYPGVHNTRGLDLSSIGPDGQEGTQDDIDNWTQK
jgi:general secretion pathway protein G